MANMEHKRTFGESGDLTNCCKDEWVTIGFLKVIELYTSPRRVYTLHVVSVKLKKVELL